MQSALLYLSTNTNKRLMIMTDLPIFEAFRLLSYCFLFLILYSPGTVYLTTCVIVANWHQQSASHGRGPLGGVKSPGRRSSGTTHVSGPGCRKTLAP